MDIRFKSFVRGIYLGLRRSALWPLLIFRKTKTPPPAEIKNILVLRHDRIGDMVMSTPVFAALKRKYPGAFLTVLASGRNKDIILKDPNVDEVLIYKGLSIFAKEFGNRKVDLAIDLFYTYEMAPAFLAYISGARYRLGFEMAGREIFFNIAGAGMSRPAGMSGHFRELMGKLHADTGDWKARLYLTDEEAAWAADIFGSKGFKAGDLKIALSPGAYYPSQRWPEENFAALAKWIVRKFNAKIILFGGSGEEAMIRRIGSGMDAGRVEMFYNLGVRQFMALLSRCDLLVCNNSGPLHVASALSTPTVSITGPTDPVLWAPAGENDIVIRKDLPCSPCGRPFCLEHDCLKLITVEEVMREAEVQVRKGARRID